MDQISIILGVEDPLSEAVVKKILADSGRSFVVANCIGLRGYGYLRKRIKDFNNAAKGIPFFVLTDLDRAECPPALIKVWLPIPKSKNLLFRVAVREVEAWLLADREGFSTFLKIPKEKIPDNVEALVDPKQTLIDLARKSRNRLLREGIAPMKGHISKVGPDYNGTLIRFVSNYWNIKEALKNSPSFKKTVEAVASFTPS